MMFSTVMTLVLWLLKPTTMVRSTKIIRYVSFSADTEDNDDESHTHTEERISNPSNGQFIARK